MTSPTRCGSCDAPRPDGHRRAACYYCGVASKDPVLTETVAKGVARTTEPATKTLVETAREDAARMLADYESRGLVTPVDPYAICAVASTGRLAGEYERGGDRWLAEIDREISKSVLGDEFLEPPKSRRWSFGGLLVSERPRREEDFPVKTRSVYQGEPGSLRDSRFPELEREAPALSSMRVSYEDSVDCVVDPRYERRDYLVVVNDGPPRVIGRCAEVFAKCFGLPLEKFYERRLATGEEVLLRPNGLLWSGFPSKIGRSLLCPDSPLDFLIGGDDYRVFGVRRRSFARLDRLAVSKAGPGIVLAGLSSFAPVPGTYVEIDFPRDGWEKAARR